MIPKIIHYGWFGGKAIPPRDQECIKTWKKLLPDFEIKRWDETNFPIEIPYMKRCYDDKKWGLLIDYVKFYVTYTEGGIYLDTDMMILKPMDHLLDQPSFWGFENSFAVNTAIIGSEAHNPIIGECLKFYTDFQYNDEYLESPRVLTPKLTKRGLIDDTGIIQHIEDAAVYPTRYFYPMPFGEADQEYEQFIQEDSLTLHLWNATWFDEFRFFWGGRYKAGFKAVGKKILKNPFQSIQFYRNTVYHIIRYAKLKIKSEI